jgi:tetratricopeptide (TPR) repeat protein
MGLAGLLVAVAVGAAQPVWADQRDPRLDKLFEKLDEVDKAEGRQLVQKIWSIWYEHDDEAVSRAMRDGQNALRAGEPGVALAMFDQAARLAPQYAEAWNARATVHYMLGNYKKSLSDIERVLDLEPRHFGALAGRGLCHTALGNKDKALDAFEASLDVNPHQPGTQRRAKKLREALEGQGI